MIRFGGYPQIALMGYLLAIKAGGLDHIIQFYNKSRNFLLKWCSLNPVVRDGTVIGRLKKKKIGSYLSVIPIYLFNVNTKLPFF